MIKKLLTSLAVLCAMASAQVPVTPAVVPHLTFANNAGLPCVGCSLFTYTAGTTTPSPTFTDSAGVSQNTNPIILGADGGANIWLGTNSYKFVLIDTLGDTIFTVDNVNSSSVASCGTIGAIQASNSGGTGFSCDAAITINTSNHTINIGTLPTAHVSIGALGTPTTWSLDTTSPVTGLASFGVGALQAGAFPGVDIGARVNAAIAANTAAGHACGTVAISQGTLSNLTFSTQILKPRCVTIDGNNAVLTWTGNSTLIPAIVVGSIKGVDDTTQGGIRHLKLIGNVNASGIYLGNKVGSYVVPSNTNIQDFLETFLDVNVVGFYDNYVKGSNVFQDTWMAGSSDQASHAEWNDVGMFGSENMSFFGWEAVNGQGGTGFLSADLAGAEYNFYNCSFDYNAGGAFNYIDGIVRINGGHIEEFSNMGPIVTSPTSPSALTLIISGAPTLVVGCDPAQGGSCTTLPALFVIGGTNSNVMIAPGLTLSLASNMTNTTTKLIQWNALGSSNDLIVGDYTEPLAITAITIPPVQANPNVQWLSVPQYTQFVATNRLMTDGTFTAATIGDKLVGSHFIGSTSNGAPSATLNAELPFNGYFLGWNGDSNGEANAYNPFINNTGIEAFNWKTKLVDGTWVNIGSITRGGFYNSPNGYMFNGTLGFTGTKTAGSCSLTIQGGIITNVTGC